MELSCHNCGHEWDYTGSKSDYTTCPSCNSSVKISGGTKGKMDTILEKVEKIEERQKEIDKKLSELPTFDCPECGETQLGHPDNCGVCGVGYTWEPDADEETDEEDAKDSKGGILGSTTPYDPVQEFE